MPVVSQDQRRAMYAAAEGKSNLGIPKSVGREFVQSSHGLTGLPEKKSSVTQAIGKQLLKGR
jgi:hypothetical protein